MRITSFMIFDQLTRGMQRQTEDLGRLNQQLVTGKKINKPSDDVLGMRNAMDYRLNLQEIEQFDRNGQQASTILKFTETIMTTVSDTLSQLSSLVRDASRGMSDPASRALNEEKAKQLRDQLLDMANSKFGDRYLFSGFRTDTRAYDTTTYNYQGDQGTMNVMIDKGASVAINDPGDKVFSKVFSAPTVVQVGGNFVHYTPGAGTVTTVEIRASDDTTVLDSFSFSNTIQMADILGSAIAAQNGSRIDALATPFTMIVQNAANIQSMNQLRVKRIDDQKNLNISATNLLKDFLSKTEDADLTQVATEMKQMQVALTAMQISSSNMLQQSLMDFLN